MLAKLIEWVKRLLGLKPQPVTEPVDTFTEAYEDVTAENLTAVIAGRLSTLTVGQSTVEITGEGLREDMLREVSEHLWRKMPAIVAQAFGKGGKVLLPVVTNGAVTVHAIDPSRITVLETAGEKLIRAVVLAESLTVGESRYHRVMEYRLDTQSGLQTITQRCISDAGRYMLMQTVPEWAAIEEEITIEGTNRLLFGWLRCPRDSRGGASPYGVPITWGASQELSEVVEHIKWYRREFKLSRPMLGMDSTLWRNMESPAIADIRRTVQDDETPFVPVQYGSIGGSQQWQHFAPPIRSEAYETRLQTLYRRLEKACGLSQGILTERQTMNYANRDEVRSAMYDTFSVISTMRTEIESAYRDVLYAVDVLCERFALTPAGARGRWEALFDWDMSLLESTAQTFQQLSELQGAGLITGARLVQWVLGCDGEKAQAEVDAAKLEHSTPAPFDGFTV